MLHLQCAQAVSIPTHLYQQLITGPSPLRVLLKYWVKPFVSCVTVPDYIVLKVHCIKSCSIQVNLLEQISQNVSIYIRSL